MKCAFCPNPAAHPATGCVYGARTLACRECVIRFWAWLRKHVNHGTRKGRPDFYQAAGKYPPG